MHKLITITTDFGDQFAASQLRVVIASLGFGGQVVENHSVTPFSISEGAFQLKQLAQFAPDGAVHVGVIDPGVGSERWGVVVKTQRSWFVGPNNGLLYPAANSEGIHTVWRLHESAFGDNVSNTFHGRDVFVKAAVYLSQGKNPTYFGSTQINEQSLGIKSFLDGEIIHIDAYGNYKIHWPHQLTMGKRLIIETRQNKRFTIPVVKTFDDVAPHKPLALLGSHSTLEIAFNLANAREKLQFALGERLTIQQVE